MRDVACALLLLAAGFAGPATATVESDPIATLEAALARHPDDPDLRFALARQLADAGRLDEAAAHLARFLEGWPERRPDAELLLGSWLYRLGRDEEAVAHLERAVARDPASGGARLLLGLALKRLGRSAEAETQLELAGRAEPALRGDALLMRGLMRLEAGDEDGGVKLLRETIALDPEGEPARNARLVLGDDVVPEVWRRVRLEAWSGVDYDSNVTLDSDTELSSLARSDDDAVFRWGTAATFHPLVGARGGLALGYRYDQNAHLELDEYDQQSHVGFASGRWRVGERVTLRMDGLFAYSRLDDHPYLLHARSRPNVFFAIGPRAGVLRLFALGEWLDYEDPAPFPSLDRDGWAYGAGLEHAFALPGWSGGWASLETGYRRLDTEGGVDALGFDASYDHDRWRGLGRLHLPLPFALHAELAAAFGYEDYDHRNVIDFLDNSLSGNLDPDDADERRDFVTEIWLRLARPITRFAEAELAYRFTDRSSNVALYDYDRHTVGLTVRVHTPRTGGGKESAR